MECKKYIIYGAGKQGRAYLDFLIQKGLDSGIIGFCDQCSDEVRRIADKQVFSYDEARTQDAAFIVAIGDEEVRKEVYKVLDADAKEYCSIDEFARSAGMGRVAFNREFCAVFHMDNMDEYFERAESDADISVFWDQESEFKKLFLKLDLENVIELACGRGRHVPQYMNGAGHITLVDILEKNIEYCKKRFQDRADITYYRNNGYDLEELEEDTYTALFSYDAMVHFEMMDIYQYLTDIYRVLIAGGKVLLHHSNNDDDYRVSFNNTRHGRNFMNREIFAYLAYRAGFEVLEQKIIDWDGYANLDCITLLQKPV